MGLYSPKGKIAYYSSFPVEKGNIALVFQSGDLHSKMVKFGSRRYNLRFSLGISIGNCIDLQISEVLQYYDEDKDTDVICVYFEGLPSTIKDEGKRLLNTLKSMTKPVLFMRGGKTERGQKAVITHTGSLATNNNIWNAVFNQTNIIEVPSSIEELINYAYLFSKFIKRFKDKGKNVVFPKSLRSLVILWSGGFGILATDTLEEMGMELPYFEGEALEKLKEIYPIKIGSLTNPFDLPWITSNKVFLEVSKAAIDDSIDFVIVETDAWKDLESERFKGYYNNLVGIKNHVESLNKVFVIILHEYPSESRAIFVDMLIKNDFLVYPTLESAARAFLKLYEYGKKLKKIKS
jgi:acyl-CoA synthetase (NDP forming)